MTWLIPFIVGWWGTLWWPGITHDAPPKGPLPDPWWWRIALGIAGGLGAIVLISIARGSAEPVPGISVAFSEPMPGIAAALAAGGVIRSVFSGIRSALSR